jgi:hypothetical protein
LRAAHQSVRGPEKTCRRRSAQSRNQRPWPPSSMLPNFTPREFSARSASVRSRPGEAPPAGVRSLRPLLRDAVIFGINFQLRAAN